MSVSTSASPSPITSSRSSASASGRRRSCDAWCERESSARRAAKASTSTDAASGAGGREQRHQPFRDERREARVDALAVALVPDGGSDDRKPEEREHHREQLRVLEDPERQM